MSDNMSSNMNQMSSNRAVLQIPGLSNTTYTIINFKLPSITLPAARVQSPFAINPWMGDKLEYDPLDVDILVSADMKNWLELHDWIRGLGAPKTKEEFVQKELTYIDSYVTVYSAQNNPMFKFKFLDCVPVLLSGVEFGELMTETDVRICNFRLEYSRYDIIRD